jgi:protein SCO1/2
VILTIVLGVLTGFFAVAGSAAAAEHLHGLVLSADAAKREAIVRHDPVGGMPGMTMPFRIAPAEGAAPLHPGDVIDAELDTSGDPWTLRAVRVTGHQGMTGGAPAANGRKILRDVHHLVTGEAVPATEFSDEAGKPFSFVQLRGSVAVLAFVYTRCRDPRMCPLIAAKFQALQTQLRGEPAHLVLVTLDPGFDTPAVLQRYAAALGADPARWTFATGDPDRVLDFAAQFGVTAFPDERFGLIHPERTAVIDEGGVIRQLIDETSWAPSEIAASVRHVRNESSNPFARFNLWMSERAVALCGNSVAQFSGYADLAATLAIFIAFGWILYRIARRIFAA